MDLNCSLPLKTPVCPFTNHPAMIFIFYNQLFSTAGIFFLPQFHPWPEYCSLDDWWCWPWSRLLPSASRNWLTHAVKLQQPGSRKCFTWSNLLFCLGFNHRWIFLLNFWFCGWILNIVKFKWKYQWFPQISLYPIFPEKSKSEIQQTEKYSPVASILDHARCVLLFWRKQTSVDPRILITTNKLTN